VRRALLAAMLWAAAPLGAVAAQAPWAISYFPYPFGNPTTGPMLVARFQVAQQADYFARVPFTGIFSVEAGASTLGSRFARTRFHAPGLVDGWRFLAEAGAERESRFGYYGLGPDAAATPPPPGPEGPPPFPFRVRRARYWIQGEVTRRIIGPLQVAAAAGVEHDRWSALPGTSVFRDQFGAALEQTDLRGRLSLVLDLQDREFVTAKGLLAEAGLIIGRGGEDRNLGVIPQGSYSGWYAHVRGFVSPREGTVVAARAVARQVSPEATLAARFTLPGWERDVVAPGGADSHRSFVRGRWGGRGLGLASLEVRHNLLDVGDYGALTILVFSDAALVTEPGGFDLDLPDFEVGYGGGLALRVLRSALLTFNFAGGPDGFVFSMGNGWAF
jgi:hypothetical protein